MKKRCIDLKSEFFKELVVEYGFLHKNQKIMLQDFSKWIEKQGYCLPTNRIGSYQWPALFFTILSHHFVIERSYIKKEGNLKSVFLIVDELV